MYSVRGAGIQKASSLMHSCTCSANSKFKAHCSRVLERIGISQVCFYTWEPVPDHILHILTTQFRKGLF